MKLLSNIRNWFQHRSTLPVQQRSLSFSQSWLRGQEDEQRAGANLVSALQQSVWVYSCITSISEQIAHIPFVFSRGERGGEERVEAGAVVELFNQPDPQMDRFLFWDLVCQWLLLRGKVYLVALDASGAVLPLGGRSRRAGDRAPYPVRLVLLNPDRVRPLRGGHELAGYHYYAAPNDPIGSQNFLTEEVVSLRMAYAYDYLEGLPPLGVAMIAAQTDYASAQLMKGLVLNNADSGLIVTTKESLTDEQKFQMLGALRERKRAAGTADRPLFLSNGCRVETPPLSLADLQFLENRKFNRQEICAIFRVPQEVLGYAEDANRAVAESVRLSFIENRIVPFCQRLESAVEPIVKMFDSELWGFFDWESLPIMQTARRMRYQSARQGFEMGVPLNVLNQVFDLGLPKLGHGDVSFLPGNWQAVGGTTKESQKAEVRSQKGRVERLEELLGFFNPNVPRALAEPTVLGDSMVRGLEGKFSKFFFEQRARTLAKMQNAECRMQNAGKEAPHPNPLPVRRGEGEAATIFDVAGEDEGLVERFRPVLLANLEECARQEGENGAGGLKLSAADSAAFLEEREGALKEINEKTWADLKGALGRVRIEDFGVLTKRVKEVFQSAADCRARELAEREVRVARSYVRNLGVLAEGDELADSR